MKKYVFMASLEGIMDLREPPRVRATTITARLLKQSKEQPLELQHKP